MNIELFIYFIAALAVTFTITVLALRRLIPKLKSIKMGQKILEVGPRWHKNKEGTPTMGGLSFIFASTVVMLILGTVSILTRGVEETLPLILTYVMALLNGAIGFLDDYVKFFKKRNEGLSAKQKYLLQLIVAGGYLLAMRMFGFITTEMYIPYADITVDLGFFYYVIALIALTGIVNGVNLNDGLDGLASSVAGIIAGFFAVAGFVYSSLPAIAGSGILLGSCLGFLVYNFYPARVFMGDTGSLYLGGWVIGLAFLIGNPLIIVVVGVAYIIECVSVALQVIYFKLTHGKRLFKMAPIHHHFEKCGWSEVQIIGLFSLITLIACVGAYFGLK